MWTKLFGTEIKGCLGLSSVDSWHFQFYVHGSNSMNNLGDQDVRTCVIFLGPKTEADSLQGWCELLAGTERAWLSTQCGHLTSAGWLSPQNLECFLWKKEGN